jgi:hypothetical protein
MTKSIDPTRLNPARSRREALGLLGAGALMLGMEVAPATAREQSDGDNVLTEALVLRDPDIPVGGNADGDITIVEYFDYQCPYCRKIAPELRQVVQGDGKVRLVLKDWPILGPISVVASRMALASKYQDKYIQAHEALIGINSKLTEPRLRATSPPTPRPSTRSWRATAIKPRRSASRARRPLSWGSFACPARSPGRSSIRPSPMRERRRRANRAAIISTTS